MKRLVTLACSLALLGACGSDSGSSSGTNTTPATATTSTAAPQSTVAVATVPTTNAPITVATVAPTTEATTETSTEPTDKPSATTGATGTTVATTTSTTTAASGSEYTKVASPVVPAETAEIHADNSHPDGVYYATVTEGGDPPPAKGTVVFELVQLFTGDACTTHFGPEDEDSCVNDYGVETDPTSTIEVPLAGQYITVADAATQDSLKISGAELYGLLHGDDPSAGAPEDYLYSGFGFIVTVSGGEVTRLEQWWTP